MSVTQLLSNDNYSSHNSKFNMNSDLKDKIVYKEHKRRVNKFPRWWGQDIGLSIVSTLRNSNFV